MKVLFLDIDGVLNCMGSNATKARCGQFMGVDRTMANKLMAFVKANDIKIVLSSTWRKHPDMWPHLHDAGIHWIDVTPLGDYDSRGVQINAWLADKPVKAYAILDDITVFLPDQMPRLVNTDLMIGLTDDHITQLVNLFKTGV